MDYAKSFVLSQNRWNWEGVQKSEKFSFVIV